MAHQFLCFHAICYMYSLVKPYNCKKRRQKLYIYYFRGKPSIIDFPYTGILGGFREAIYMLEKGRQKLYHTTHILAGKLVLIF